VRLALFFELALLEPSTPTFLRGAIAPLLVVCFGPNLRYFDGTTISINCNERQIARVGVPPNAGEEILGLDAHADFHRRPAHEVHTRLHDNEVAEVNGFSKVDTIDRGGDDARTTMPKCGDGSTLVHHRENDSAKHMPHVVRVLGHHEL